ncbi:MAG: DHH family phosphoesterase [Spirochaetes bacterium]|nr:DHH family phosphoesterase [Spirochaetota bacterium]
MSLSQNFLDFIRLKKPLFIQTHNFPDHDAVASAYALQTLLRHFQIPAQLVYEGEIQRDSLKNMIDHLNIKIKHINHYDMLKSDKIIIVDGCKGNKNVTDLIGDEIAIIDHHQVESPDDVPFSDIRSHYGACSTIIYHYFYELGVNIPQDVATALLIGINMDTSLLTRDVSQEDVLAYSHLYDKSDIRLVNTILRNYIQVKDLKFYQAAINNLNIKNSLGFCYFPDGCNQNLLGILGDFFLALEEIDFVVLCAKNGNRINFSVRNEKPEWNAAFIIEKLLQGIGFGGGHIDMAGGIISDAKLFSEKDIYNKLIHYLGLN